MTAEEVAKMVEALDSFDWTGLSFEELVKLYPLLSVTLEKMKWVMNNKKHMQIHHMS